MLCEVFKRTTDNWRPSYKMDDGKTMLASVTFTQIEPESLIDVKWRVCVWGNDDCGMELDFDDEKIAWCCFLRVIGLDDVTIAALLELGFVSA